MRASWAPLVLLAGVCTVAGCKSEEASAPKPAPLPPAPATSAEKPAPPPPPEPAPEPAAEAVPEPPKTEETVAGNIVLPKARKKDVKKGDTMFLIVRRAGGAPGPGSMLAVQKLTVDEFPMPFVVSERDAMIPGSKFSGEVNLSVRVDKDGDPMTRRKGDVFGEIQGVKVGTQDVALPLDTLQKEDQTLGGGMGAPPHGGGMPSHGGGAMPPGHP